MRIRPCLGWFLAYTAAFAVLAGFVFWGTWSLDVAPVMPDCPVTYPKRWIADWFAGFLRSGKFNPDDVKVFLASPYLWQELQYAFAMWCSGLGLAYFCRGRGLSLPACYGGGLLLAFCGYWASLFSAGHLGWFRWMTYGTFAFGLADRAIRKGKAKNWLLLGACLAWGSMYQPDLWLLFTIFTAVYFIYRTISSSLALPSGTQGRFWRRWTIGGLMALAAMTAIGSASFRNAFVNDLASRDKQIERGETLGKDVASDPQKARWVFTTNWSMPPEDTLEFIRPGVHGDTSCPISLALAGRFRTGLAPYTGRLGRPLGASEGNYRQHSLYVGLVTCLLALLGIAISAVRMVKDKSRVDFVVRDVAFFAISALVFWMFSLGRFLEPVYYWTVYQLPFGDSLRAPVKWHHLTEFCIAVLAAYGIDALLRTEWLKARAWTKWLVLAVVLVGAFDLARVDKRHCLPLDVKSARRTGMNANFTFIPTQQFTNPQVADMVRRGYIMPLASYPGRQDVMLVEVLEPRDPVKIPPVDGLVLSLGIISILATIGVAAYGVKKS